MKYFIKTFILKNYKTNTDTKNSESDLSKQIGFFTAYFYMCLKDI